METKTKYDFAFSLGAGCASSLALRYAHKQFTSLPFDWVAGTTVFSAATLVANGFEHFLDYEDMELTDVLGWVFNSSIYRNRRTGITFSHDFPAGCYLEEELPVVRAKYERRIRRLYAEIEKSKRVLAVFNEIPYRAVPSDAEMMEAQRILQARFPSVRIDLVVFAQDPERQDREPVRLNENVTKVLLDYLSIDNGYIAAAARYDKLVRYFNANIAIDDPRTPEEIAAYDAAARRRDEERWGTGFKRFVNKRAFKLYRHFEKFLVKRGCIPSGERPLKLYKDHGERKVSLSAPDASSLPRDEAAMRHAYGML